MKTKYFNYRKLAEEEIHDRVIRVKALMINDDNEILIGEAFDTVQFPGGHVKEGEALEKALKREVKEETGITLKGKFEPFYAIKYFLKDFPVKGNNRSIEIYYFKIVTNQVYNLEKATLDDQERNGNFSLKYLPVEYLPKYLKKHVKNNKINKIVNRELVLALKNLE